jgi:hypothetical protein
MVDRALYDFAEAAMGRNSEMRWSLSTSIMRRQVTPIFERCAEGELSAEAALDIAVDFTAIRVANTLEIFNTLFETLEARIDVQLHGESFPTLVKLQEFFLGLTDDVDWATDQNIARKELYPLFVHVAVGSMQMQDAIIVFCDNVNAKKEFYLELLRALIYTLTEEIVAAQKHHNLKQGTTNGDD